MMCQGSVVPSPSRAKTPLVPSDRDGMDGQTHGHESDASEASEPDRWPVDSKHSDEHGSAGRDGSDWCFADDLESKEPCSEPLRGAIQIGEPVQCGGEDARTSAGLGQLSSAVMEARGESSLGGGNPDVRALKRGRRAT